MDMKTDMKREKHFGFMMDDELHYKFRYISNYWGRSMRQQILFLMRQAVLDFEKEHSPIHLPQEDR